jgi:hypothetical protein
MGQRLPESGQVNPDVTVVGPVGTKPLQQVRHGQVDQCCYLIRWVVRDNRADRKATPGEVGARIGQPEEDAVCGH